MSWLDERLLTRNEALTAMSLADAVCDLDQALSGGRRPKDESVRRELSNRLTAQLGLSAEESTRLITTHAPKSATD